MKKYIKIKPSNKTIKSFNIYDEIKDIEKNCFKQKRPGLSSKYLYSIQRILIVTISSITEIHQ